ncbi:sensor histidine kinase [Dactylosporangium sp. McL0621]|uniref:sensor histidine kinase n=1 Tax=Dactylosporangium sp. McL0621 TaxID=3415678 RepID=UPI003CF4E6CF
MVVLLVSLVLAAGAGRSQPGTRPVDGWAYGLVVVSCAALLVRRRYPLPVAGVLGAALLAFAVRDYPGGPLVVAVMVALYTVGVRLGRRQALAAAAVAAVLVAARSATAVAAHGQVSAFSWAAPGWVVACLLAGMVVRARRQTVQALRDRAELAERSKDEEARARVAEERLRIARDLHDVVGHSFAAVHVQARAAAALLDTDPAAARHAMAAIEATSRDALREIRATLSTLRHTPTTPAVPAATARLHGLLGTARAAGLTVHTAIDETIAALPAPVEEVVYRVVQEALTNVLRHADATTVTVTIATDADGTRVDVRDDGLRAPQTDGGHGNTPGHGLAGMRERVAAVHGRLDTGPVEDRGWRVTAWLPVQS